MTPHLSSRPCHRWLLALCLSVLPFLSACFTTPPQGVAVVSPFDVKRYAGQWYEIARLDHRFERGLSDVSATYGLNADGTVSVVNRGFDTARGEWKEAKGVARFTGDPGTGSLRVSFFGPFYGGYHVIALDPGLPLGHGDRSRHRLPVDPLARQAIAQRRARAAGRAGGIAGCEHP